MKTLTRLFKALVLLLFLTTCSKDSNVGSDDVVSNHDVIYGLTSDVIPDGRGTITPNSGTFNKGEQILITASPSADKFTFKNWSDDISMKTQSIPLILIFQRNFKMNIDKNQAVFAQSDREVGILGVINLGDEENSPLKDNNYNT